VGYNTSKSQTEVLAMRLIRRDRTTDAGRLALVQARARGAALDRALLDGADPRGSAALRSRAALLTSRSHRDSLAGGIERMLDALDRPAPQMRVIPQPAALRANEQPLRRIADTLRGSAPVYAPGVALVGALVTDGLGPAHAGDADALAHALEDAQGALAGRAPVSVAPLLAPRRSRVRGGTPATRASEALALSSDPAVYRRHEAA
jgi:hypothetical protein